MEVDKKTVLPPVRSGYSEVMFFFNHVVRGKKKKERFLAHPNEELAGTSCTKAVGTEANRKTIMYCRQCWQTMLVAESTRLLHQHNCNGTTVQLQA